MDETQISELQRFVDLYGNAKKAAQAIGFTESAMSRWRSGGNRLTIAVCRLMEKTSGGRVRKEVLAFGADAKRRLGRT